ncbi:MAG: DUF3592 domain-containing protein [Promethearchaeota archaeon]
MAINIKQAVKYILSLAIFFFLLIILISVFLLPVLDLLHVIPNNSFYIGLYAIIFGLGGLLASFFFIRSLLEVKASTKWPSTEGKIISSFLDVRQGEEGFYYQPVINYSYNVEGREYGATRVIIGQLPMNTGKKWAHTVLDNYPMGKSVRVHYDPRSPTKAVLEPGMNSQYKILWFLTIVIGGLFLCIISFILTCFIETMHLIEIIEGIQRNLSSFLLLGISLFIIPLIILWGWWSRKMVHKRDQKAEIIKEP